MRRRAALDPTDLFAAEALPAGLIYRADFLSPHEEAQLVDGIAGLTLRPAPYKSYLARRRIASFGSAYDFDAQRLNAAPPLPGFLEPLRARVAGEFGVELERLQHVLVTEYTPGTPLGWHRDTPEFEGIAGVSLAGSCELRWRRFPPRSGDPVLRLEVAPRSLYLVRGDARWGWQHSVAPTRELRYSITLRTLASRSLSPR